MFLSLCSLPRSPLPWAPSCGIRSQSLQWGGTGLSGPSLLASFLPVALELAGVSAPRDLGRYLLLESLLPDASPSPSAPLGSSSPFPILGSFLKDRNLKTSKNQSF